MHFLFSSHSRQFCIWRIWLPIFLLAILPLQVMRLVTFVNIRSRFMSSDSEPIVGTSNEWYEILKSY